MFSLYHQLFFGWGWGVVVVVVVCCGVFFGGGNIFQRGKGEIALKYAALKLTLVIGSCCCEIEENRETRENLLF